MARGTPWGEVRAWSTPLLGAIRAVPDKYVLRGAFDSAHEAMARGLITQAQWQRIIDAVESVEVETHG